MAQVLVKELKGRQPGHDPTVLTFGCLLLMASRGGHTLDKARAAHGGAPGAGDGGVPQGVSNKAVQLLEEFLLRKRPRRCFTDLAEMQALQLEQSKESEPQRVKAVQGRMLSLLKADASCSKAW